MQERERTMEYSAASVKFLLWYIETKETAKLLENLSFEEIRQMVTEENLYQQKSVDRAIGEFGCIKISYDEPIIANSTEKDPRYQLMREKFILKSGSYNRGKDYYLVLIDMEDQTKEHHRYKFEIDIAGI